MRISHSKRPGGQTVIAAPGLTYCKSWQRRWYGGVILAVVVGAIEDVPLVDVVVDPHIVGIDI